jgi:hypothetical protein
LALAALGGLPVLVVMGVVVCREVTLYLAHLPLLVEGTAVFNRAVAVVLAAALGGLIQPTHHQHNHLL